MASAQNSIESIVGPPTVVIPFLSYNNGTYSFEDTGTGVYAAATPSPVLVGSAANVAGYMGARIECVIAEPSGTEANAVSIIPHHGPCPEFVTHDPFGENWGIHVRGLGDTPAGESTVQNIFVDTQFCMQYLSVEMTINCTASALVGVTVYPMIPRTSSPIDSFTQADLLKVFESGDLDLTA